MKKTTYGTLEFEPYNPQSVASVLTLGELKELVDKLFFSYGSQSGFSLSSEKNYGSWQVSQSIVIPRIETEGEYTERMIKEGLKGKQERAIREAQYLKLKAEFEGSALADIVEKYKDSPPLPFSGFGPVALMDKQE